MSAEMIGYDERNTRDCRTEELKSNLGSNLVAALTGLKVDNFSHGEGLVGGFFLLIEI